MIFSHALRSFWTDSGWHADDTNAQLRLDSRLRVDAQSLVEVQLARKDDQGGWQNVDPSDPAYLTLAMQCRAHPIIWRGQQRICFWAPRHFQPELVATLDPSWDWRTLDGQMLLHPALASGSWHLPMKEARALWKLLQSHGWQLIQDNVLSTHVDELTASVKQLASGVDRLSIRLGELAEKETLSLSDLTAHGKLLQTHASAEREHALLHDEYIRQRGWWRHLGGVESKAELAKLRDVAVLLVAVRRTLQSILLPEDSPQAGQNIQLLAQLGVALKNAGAHVEMDHLGLHVRQGSSSWHLTLELALELGELALTRNQP